jgi:hypothetical protein
LRENHARGGAEHQLAATKPIDREDGYQFTPCHL